MFMKQLQYTRRAVKGLRRMPRAQAAGMMKALSEIAQGNEQAKDIKRLVGTDDFRLRKGGYRALYCHTEKGITVLVVGPRGDIYK